MKDKKNVFEIQPPVGHAERIENSVADLLIQKKASERRKHFQWLLVPAFATVAGILLWKKQESGPEPLLADQDIIEEIQDESDLDVIADLEMLEELDFLEEWNESENS